MSRDRTTTTNTPICSEINCPEPAMDYWDGCGRHAWLRYCVEHQRIRETEPDPRTAALRQFRQQLADRETRLYKLHGALRAEPNLKEAAAIVLAHANEAFHVLAEFDRLGLTQE